MSWIMLRTIVCTDSDEPPLRESKVAATIILPENPQVSVVPVPKHLDARSYGYVAPVWIGRVPLSCRYPAV